MATNTREQRLMDENAQLIAENVELVEWHGELGRGLAEVLFAVEELGRRIDAMESAAAV
jgi:hypothetical protein